MISKEVLAKVNKLAALALTKDEIKVELSANQYGVKVGVHQFVDTAKGIKVCGDVGYGNHYVYLEKSNALSDLNKQIAWVKGLEDRHGL
jgi:hypothetical protein